MRWRMLWVWVHLALVAGESEGPRRFPSVSPDLWSVGLDHDSGMSLRRGRTGVLL